MTKKDDEILAKRKATLDVTFELSRDKHEKRSGELLSQSRKAELILIAWGFIFAGIAGFYQAGILNIHNTTEIVFLLLPILISVLICVIQVISRQEERDVPKLSELWKQYTQSYEKDFAEYNDISAKEQLVQEYISSEEYNRKKLNAKAHWLTAASWLIAVEIALLIIFVILESQPVYLPC